MKKLLSYFLFLVAQSFATLFLPLFSPFANNLNGSLETQTHLHPSNARQNSQVLFSLKDLIADAEKSLQTPKQDSLLANELGLKEEEEEPLALSLPEKKIPDDEPVAQKEDTAKKTASQADNMSLINYNNVDVVTLIRFISKISNKNFFFNEQDLNFQVTIISEEPTTIENVLLALMQELRIHDFSMIEQGDNIIIHNNANVRSPGMVKADSLPETLLRKGDIVTQVFRLNTANATNVAAVIKPMLSSGAILDVLIDTNYLILTDFDGNVQKIATLIKSIDAPNSTLIIGQYVVRNAFMSTLLANAELILQSIAPGQLITFVPHAPSNSIFIISNPYLVERAIPILQRLDQTNGVTGIYNLNDLKYVPPESSHIPTEAEIQENAFENPPERGKWYLDKNGNWNYEPNQKALEAAQATQAAEAAEGAEGAIPPPSIAPPKGYWKQGLDGNWDFIPGEVPEGEDAEQGPKGLWQRGPNQKWSYKLTQGEPIYAGKKTYYGQPEEGIFYGQPERTKFFIYKLNYRLGDSIQSAMLKISDSMKGSDTSNQNLISTINSVQWLEPSNSLIFTGDAESLLKVKELLEEIDQPLRQVFIEMLILDTTVTDSLNYSVNWGEKFITDNGNLAGAQAFQSDASIVSSIIGGAGTVANAISNGINNITGLNPNPIINSQNGYSGGVIGQKICAGGLEFTTLGAFVRAVHTKADANIVMNPKIITEDNVTAEIFVGLNTQFQTQSISNDQGSIITNNFEFRDVGTTLRVTPLLGASNIITLQIQESVSSVVSTNNSNNGLAQVNPGPTTQISRTTTQVHVPNKCFIVISGMIQDEVDRTRSHVPCLGGAPLIGALFTGKTYNDTKRCLMIFIRPQIVDTEEEIDNLTTHQQDIFRLRRRTKKMWKLDCEEAMDWMNLKEVDTLNDEFPCCDFKR